MFVVDVQGQIIEHRVSTHTMVKISKYCPNIIRPFFMCTKSKKRFNDPIKVICLLGMVEYSAMHCSVGEK